MNLFILDAEKEALNDFIQNHQDHKDLEGAVIYLHRYNHHKNLHGKIQHFTIMNNKPSLLFEASYLNSHLHGLKTSYNLINDTPILYQKCRYFYDQKHGAHIEYNPTNGALNKVSIYNHDNRTHNLTPRLRLMQFSDQISEALKKRKHRRSIAQLNNDQLKKLMRNHQPY